jgi:uncharacterized protein YndB with AHSA1/START domain
METKEKIRITVQTNVKAPVQEVWEMWNNPRDVEIWNNASEDWHTPLAENDLRQGGKFNYRMEAKDGNSGFNFTGVYDVVKPNERIEYTMGDGRKVRVSFKTNGDETSVIETFDAEDENSLELQRTGWQAILNNFKKYAENLTA